MTNEDRQRTMDFILQQQAKFAAHLEQLEEERIRDRPRLASVEKSFQRVVELLEIHESRLDRVEFTTSALETASSALETNMAALAEAQARADSGRTELEANMAALAASQARTDDKLSALMDVVRRDRNGT